MNHRLRNLLLPAFVASVIAAIIIWLLPPVFDKFTLTPLKISDIKGLNEAYFLHDFDNNGVSEMVRLGYIDKTNPYFDIRTCDDNLVLDNWVLEGGDWLDGKKSTAFGDYDHNGQDEIYAFSNKKDSIFLYALEPLGRKEFVVENRFICKGRFYKGRFDTHVIKSELCDLNGDGFQELVFSVFTGYAIQPRALYAYDIKNDTLFRSPFAMEILENFNCEDIDGDSIPEIFGTASVRGNTKLSEPVSDSLGWVLVYDNELNYKFTPVPLAHYPGGVYEYAFAENKLLIYTKYQGVEDFKSGLFLFSPKGEKTDSVMLEKGSSTVIRIKTGKYNRLFLIRNSLNGLSFFTIDKNLKLKPVLSNENFIHMFNVSLDINYDGFPEFIFSSNDENHISFKKMVITDHNFKNPVSFKVNKLYNGGFSSGRNVQKGKYYFSLSTDDKWYLFEYAQNNLYYFKFVIYAGIFFVLFLFFVLLFKYQRKSIEKKHQQEKQLTSLQLKTIKNQLDPHFTLNTLNAIGALIMKNETGKATVLFDRFSKLTRQILMSGNEIKTSLREELAFIVNYLEIQRFRFGNQFDYRIEVDEDIDRDKVFLPRLLIHTFAENAVKHGLRVLKDRKGLLTINVTYKNGKYLITIRDNGIGRKKAAKNKRFSTGKGLTIARDMVELYNRLNKANIRYEFIDMEEGTDVRVWV